MIPFSKKPRIANCALAKRLAIKFAKPNRWMSICKLADHLREGCVGRLCLPNVAPRGSYLPSKAPLTYAPISQRTDHGEVFAGPWCLGFTAGTKLRWDAWMPMSSAKGIECGLLLPIMIYCADELELPTDPLRHGLDTKSYLQGAYHDIPLAVSAI
jgi:hypothetical protein